MIYFYSSLGAGSLGLLMGILCLAALRRNRVELAHAREEMEILYRQCQTEYRDGLATVSESVTSLEDRGQQMEDALRGRFTRSLRAKAMQLIRKGHTVDQAAAELAIPRNEMRLLARVSRILTSL